MLRPATIGIAAFSLILLYSLLLSNNAILSDRLRVTPTAKQVPSLFENDTCAPPCFFGVTPGISTVEDVKTALQPWIEAGVLGADLTKLSPDSRFPFFWPYSDWEPNKAFTNNTITTEDNYVIYIDVLMNDELTLADVIETYGYPSFSLANADLSTSLLLIYLDFNINIALFSDNPDDLCELASIEDDMVVWSVEYYVLDQLSPRLELDVNASKLLNNSVLSKWLNSNETGSCAAAIGRIDKFYEGLPDGNKDA